MPADAEADEGTKLRVGIDGGGGGVAGGGAGGGRTRRGGAERLKLDARVRRLRGGRVGRPLLPRHHVEEDGGADAHRVDVPVIAARGGRVRHEHQLVEVVAVRHKVRVPLEGEGRRAGGVDDGLHGRAGRRFGHKRGKTSVEVLPAGVARRGHHRRQRATTHEQAETGGG